MSANWLKIYIRLIDQDNFTHKNTKFHVTHNPCKVNVRKDM